MKYILGSILFLIFSVDVIAQNYTAATYNIRLSLQSDGGDFWEYRKQRVANQLARNTPDIFGIQEGLHNQVSYLDQAFPKFDYAGIGRKDGKTAGEHAAIFYDTTTFKSLESGTFWLSETPDTVSLGWDADYLRICTYTLLYDETENQHLWIFNTHLDHASKQARLEGLKLIHTKIDELNSAGYPVVLMGDLNGTPDSPSIAYISDYLNDARAITQTEPEGPTGTYNGFDISHPLDRRIDYIFVSDDIQVDRYRVDHEISYSRTPSDHLPVIVNFSVQQ